MDYKTKNAVIDSILEAGTSFEQADRIIGQLCDDNLLVVLGAVLEHVQLTHLEEVERKMASRIVRDILGAVGV